MFYFFFAKISSSCFRFLVAFQKSVFEPDWGKLVERRRLRCNVVASLLLSISGTATKAGVQTSTGQLTTLTSVPNAQCTITSGLSWGHVYVSMRASTTLPWWLRLCCNLWACILNDMKSQAHSYTFITDDQVLESDADVYMDVLYDCSRQAMITASRQASTPSNLPVQSPLKINNPTVPFHFYVSAHMLPSTFDPWAFQRMEIWLLIDQILDSKMSRTRATMFM